VERGRGPQGRSAPAAWRPRRACRCRSGRRAPDYRIAAPMVRDSVPATKPAPAEF
jgi:hypothetical protein